MDIVVRTPHGDADVSIITHERGTTLGDVIVAITGQAIPRLAVVDGRAVDATTPLDDVGLLLGSLVETEPALPTVTPDTAIDIVQIAGHGAGRVTRLVPGRYRIGPGRRTSAGELDLASLDLSSMSDAGIVRLTAVSLASMATPVVLPAGCGNGFVDEGEACDGGDNMSATTPDFCRPGCIAPACGDGVKDSAEACDLGSSNSDTAVDGCRTDCRKAACGDGVVDADEECDEGANNSAVAPDSCREGCSLPRCGDRVVDSGEFCDDGPFNSDDAPERCRLDCLSANGPLNLVGGACDVPHHKRGGWPLGLFVLAALAILVPFRRRGL